MSYHLERYHKRRRAAIESLGGVCVVCGIDEDLEIDHIDPQTKTFELGKLWSIAEADYLAELSKCQLLCGKHHKAKTAKEQTTRKHGSATMYRKEGCRCGPCVQANSKYQSKYDKCRVWCKLCRKRYYKRCPIHAPLG